MQPPFKRSRLKARKDMESSILQTTHCLDPRGSTPNNIQKEINRRAMKSRTRTHGLEPFDVQLAIDVQALQAACSGARKCRPSIMNHKPDALQSSASLNAAKKNVLWTNMETCNEIVASNVHPKTPKLSPKSAAAVLCCKLS